MTNLEWIHSLSAEELAELIVNSEDDYDNDAYTSPDGTRFCFREDAVEYIKGWLGEGKN